MPKKVGDALPTCRYKSGVPPPNKFDSPTRGLVDAPQRARYCSGRFYMSLKNYNQRPNALKARALRFESLETREMLDVEPIAFLDSASVSGSNSAFFFNAVTDALPIINLVDSPTGVPFSDGDTLQLDSYYIDASGSTTKTNIKVHFRPDIFELLRKCHRIIRYPLDDCLHYSSINTN